MIYSEHDNSREGLYTVDLPSIYAHGKLEEFLGYYVVKTSSLKVFHTIHQIENGVIPFIVIQGERAENMYNEVIPVVIYLWKGKETSKLRGLIVYEKNEEDREFAREKYTSETDII